MIRLGIPAALALTAIVAACAPKPPPPPPAPVLTAAEQACAARGAEVAKVDPGTVTVVATASTKTGDTIYTTTAGGVAYNCVVNPDGVTVSTFSKQ